MVNLYNKCKPSSFRCLNTFQITDSNMDDANGSYQILYIDEEDDEHIDIE